MLKGASSPFGGQTRTRTLLLLRLLDASYPRELARVLDAPVSGVRQALAGLERDGLVSGRTVGRLRMYQLNPAYFARTELRGYLGKLAEADGELRQRAEALRRRPRRTGKPV